jgi:ubiquinone/menaquinone biosynthesis C-methylase UbiE
MSGKFTPGLSFSILTPLYDRCVRLLGFGAFARQVMRVLEATGVRGDEALLDLGCGTGTLIIELKKRFPGMAITGMDPDTKMLRMAEYKARKAGTGVELRHGFAQQMPFAGDSFDVVTSTLVFHHLPAEVKRQAMSEIRRVLKPTGFFLLADFGKPETAVLKVFLGFVGLFESLSDNVHGRLPVMLREAGFQVEEGTPGWRGVAFRISRPNK